MNAFYEARGQVSGGFIDAVKNEIAKLQHSILKVLIGAFRDVRCVGIAKHITGKI